MKLFRSELLQGLEHRLFEISADSLHVEDVVFEADVLPCTVTAVHQPDGYKLTLSFQIPYRLTCDRCLDEYRLDKSLDIVLRLTNNKLLVDSEGDDVLYFPDTMLEINLTPVIRDYIALALPVKHLCSADCKGLCPNCGINKNHDSCSCDMEKPPSPFDQLMKLNLDD